MNHRGKCWGKHAERKQLKLTTEQSSILVSGLATILARGTRKSRSQFVPIPAIGKSSLRKINRKSFSGHIEKKKASVLEFFLGEAKNVFAIYRARSGYVSRE